MNRPRNLGALRQYGQVGAHTAVESASPHRLVQMLLERGLASITAARGHLARGDVAAKGEQISHAIGVIDCLRGSLDHTRGGEIAGNLDQLYDYACRRLLEANAANDPGILDEVHGLIRQVKDGWDGIQDPAASAVGSQAAG